MKDVLTKIKCPNEMKSYWKVQWKIVIAIVLTGVIYNAMMEAGPILQGKVIDMIVSGDSGDNINRWIFIFVTVIVFIQFNRYLKRYYVRVFANRTGASMRQIVYTNIINSGAKKLANESTGDLMTKAISDVGACVEGMRKFTTEVFDTGVLMVAYFITLLYYDVKLTVVSAVFIPLAMFIAERLKSVIYKYSRNYREQLSNVAELTLENVENNILYRITGVEGIKAEEYDTELEDLEKKAILANLLENSMQPIYRVIALIGIAVIVYYGGLKTIDGVWSVGVFSAYITIFTAFSIKASKAAKLFNSVQKAQVSWQRIKPYLNVQKKSVKIIGTVNREKVNRIEVNNLSFRTVKDASFTAKTGEIIGVTGHVASGKSTIGIALQGLYPYEGSIKINGSEISTLNPKEISGFVSYMGHESQLLSDTIYNNITLGAGGDISDVIKDVCFDEDLKGMERGIATQVGASGVRLSGGQQARLALARTLYNKSDFLILDDPFSAVDSKTERDIMNNIRKNYRDCAIILISHRVDMFDSVDKVLLVNEGKTSFDTHENLMKTSKVYREIFSLQREGFHV